MKTLELLLASTTLTQELLDRTHLDDDTVNRGTPCRDFNVADLVEHVIETHRLLLSAAGGHPDTTDAGGTPGGRHRTVADQSLRTWEERGTEGTVELGGQSLPADFVLGLQAFEAFVHGWDLATALDLRFDPTPDVVEAAWGAARMIVSDDNRGTGPGAPYGPAVPCPDDASPLEALIAFTGRTPTHALRGSPSVRA